MVSDLVAMARGTRTRILVNDRVDVALACGAAGVHLRADSVPAAAVRSIAPREFAIGRSVHAVSEAVAAGAAVDYLIAGTVWPTSAKPAGHPVLGIDGLSGIVRAAGVPVLAIGGVTLDRLGEVAAHGGAGVAGIGLFMASGPGSASLPCRAVPLVEMAAAARARFDTSATAP
jgi:thiamine-phosphate diphosphorylase